MKISVSINKNLSPLFRNLGLIFINPEKMFDLEVIAGDLIVCKEESTHSKKYLFRVALPIKSFFESKNVDAQVESIYELQRDIDIEKIREKDVQRIRQLFIENASRNKIDITTIQEIKKELIKKKLPINNNGYVIVSSHPYFFKNIQHPGILSNSSIVFCYQGELEKKIAIYQNKNKELKRKIYNEKNKFENIEQIIREKYNNMENKIKRSENQIKDKQEQLIEKEQHINKLVFEIQELRKKMELKKRAQEAKSLDQARIKKIAKSYKRN